MRIFCVIILVTYSSTVQGQNKIDLSYFALGLVNDYLGRALVKSDKLDVTMVDRFHESEIVLMDFLDSLISEENNVRKENDLITPKRARENEINCGNCSQFFTYYSGYVAAGVNEKYRFRFDRSWDEKNRKVYRGTLKIRAIKSETQHMSFLLGAFVRFGASDGGLIVYNLANSSSKIDAIIRSLKKLDCEIVDVRVVEGTPTQRKISTKPSEKLISELAQYLALKDKLEGKPNYYFKHN
jgi:hypothetical protein